MRTHIDIERLTPGMKVWITESNNGIKDTVYFGTVQELRKPNKFVAYVHVVTLTVKNVQRDRWKPKVCTFANSSRLSFEFDPDSVQDARKKFAEARKTYAAARASLSAKRDELSEHLQVLGLKADCTYDQFNAVRKQGMKKYHPDILNQQAIIDQQTVETADKFRRACAFVDDYIKARDQ